MATNSCRFSGRTGGWPLWFVTRRLVPALGVLLAVLAAGLIGGCAAPSVRTEDAEVIVVMDPLARELACACVRGHAQRHYQQLADFLARRTGQRYRVVFADNIEKGLRQTDPARVALVIGKQSVVLDTAPQSGLRLKPLCRLTGKDGLTTLTGLFVVKANDSARALSDLKGRRILFGPADSDEKHAAALAALRAVGIEPPVPVETRAGCSDAALDVQESKDQPPPVAVISSYALPLLEGCETIERGSLRVVGESAPVPFVAVFVSASLSSDETSRIEKALLAVREKPELLRTMESKDGFVPYSAAPASPKPMSKNDWPGWRGPEHNGLVASLPDHLPATPAYVWKKPVTGPSLAGLAVAEGLVLSAERDPLDRWDLFRCLRAEDGEEVWRLSYLAPGELDYGQSPRATPLIHDGLAYLLGAFGNLHCVNLSNGAVRWKTNLREDFGAQLPKWGYCGSPLIVGENLIINPGAAKASLAGLDRRTGRLVWKTAGNAPAYASFIGATLGGRTQVVGYDATTLGGWDPATGRRLWTLTPPHEGDFNVPTPVVWDGKLVVATENNGTRLYGFEKDGAIQPAPLASQSDLSPDTVSPLVMDNMVYGYRGDFWCLDLKSGLKTVWKAADPGMGEYVSLIGSGGRILVATHHGELLLLDATAGKFRVLSRLRVFGEESEIYSHPALAGSRLFLRDSTTLCCLAL